MRRPCLPCHVVVCLFEVYEGFEPGDVSMSGAYRSSAKCVIEGQISSRLRLLWRICAPGWSACISVSLAMTSSIGAPAAMTATGVGFGAGGSAGRAGLPPGHPWNDRLPEW